MSEYRYIVSIVADDEQTARTVLHSHFEDCDDCGVMNWTTPLPIQPGDLVEYVGVDLDDREVVAVGRDWLTLDILGKETPRLPKDHYRTTVPADGVL